MSKKNRKKCKEKHKEREEKFKQDMNKFVRMLTNPDCCVCYEKCFFMDLDEPNPVHQPKLYGKMCTEAHVVCFKCWTRLCAYNEDFNIETVTATAPWCKCPQFNLKIEYDGWPDAILREGGLYRNQEGKQCYMMQGKEIVI